jgi:hypothetical protein
MSSEPLPKLEYFYTDSFFVKSEDVVDEFGISASAIPFPTTNSVKAREQAIVQRLKDIYASTKLSSKRELALLIQELERGE